MNFVDEMVSRELRVSKSVSKPRRDITYRSRLPIDYEEYYEIDRSINEHFRAAPHSAANFVRGCRNRELDDLLIVRPGKVAD